MQAQLEDSKATAKVNLPRLHILLEVLEAEVAYTTKCAEQRTRFKISKMIAAIETELPAAAEMVLHPDRIKGKALIANNLVHRLASSSTSSRLPSSSAFASLIKKIGSRSSLLRPSKGSQFNKELLHLLKELTK